MGNMKGWLVWRGCSNDKNHHIIARILSWKKNIYQCIFEIQISDNGAKRGEVVLKNNISLNLFILKRVIKLNPKILFYMTGAIVTSGMTPYISMVIMKIIIRMWEKNVEVNAALVQVVLLIFFAGIIYSSKAFFGNMLLPYLNDYRQSEKRILYRNIIESDFQEIETSEYWNAFQKAQLSVRRNYAGNEGVLHNWVDIGASCIPFVFAMIAIREFDFVILGIIVFFAFIGNIVMIKAEHALTEQEISLYPLRYKTERFFRIMSSISSQKEMRAGNAYELLSTKCDELTNNLVNEEKHIYSNNFWAKVLLSFLLAVQDIIIYVILLNRYRANQFDIAEWTLLIATMTMVTFELTKISGIVTQIRSNCAMVAEFKNFLENKKKENASENNPAGLTKYDCNSAPLICFEKV